MFSDFFSQVGAFDTIRVTLLMSFFSTAIASAIGISLGLLLEQHSFPGKKIVVRINRTMMGVPPVVVGLVTYMLLMRKGPLGFLGWLFTVQGMVLAQIIIITPIICGIVYTSAASIAPAIRVFAKSMGADRRQTRLLTMSEMRSEIYFAIVTGFGRSISEVGAVLLVGGNIKNMTRTMTTAIATLQSAGVFKDGVMLGAILLVMAFIVMVVADRVRKEDVYDENF